MNKSELIAAVAVHTGQDSKQVAATLRGLEEVVQGTVAKGEQVTFTGFVKFEKVRRPARTSRNPQTGEPVKVKAKNAPKVSPLATFKNVIAGVAPAPKLAKAAPVAKAAPARKAAPAKKAAATAKAAPAKKAASAKKAAPAKKAAAKKK